MKHGKEAHKPRPSGCLKLGDITSKEGNTHTLSLSWYVQHIFEKADQIKRERTKFKSSFFLKFKKKNREKEKKKEKLEDA